MNIFKGIEKKLEGLVEGGFGRAFKASVQPVELAHKLAKEMGDHKTVGVANVYVPNEFDIYLGHNDYEHLTGLGDPLRTELGHYVTAYAAREGWTLVAPPRVELHEDDDLRLGEFGIGTRTVGEPESSAPPERPQSDQTVLYQEPPAAAAAGVERAMLRGAAGQWELADGVYIVGRSRRSTIVVDDPNVSRQHAEIRRDGSGFVIRDMGSTNGVRVNGRPVAQAVLQHGDRIEMGATELLFERVS